MVRVCDGRGGEHGHFDDPQGGVLDVASGDRGDGDHRAAAADDPRAAPLSREVGDVPFECDVKTVM